MAVQSVPLYFEAKTWCHHYYYVKLHTKLVSLAMPEECLRLRLDSTLAFLLTALHRDGVMLAADTLASYGSLARYKNVERIKP